MLSDDRVSRRQAMIQSQADEYWLVDLGSANGTYLNGRRIIQAQRLADKDQIKIGGFSLLFRKPHSQSPAREMVTSTEKTVLEIKTLDCWLLVGDIEDSTGFLKRLAPQEGPRLTGRWLSDCKQIVEENRGVMNKYLGDGFLAYWLNELDLTVPVGRAMQSLKTLQEKKQLHFRTVLHFGSVEIGGGGSLGEESLGGNEVNFVFRMEKLAASMGQPRLVSGPAQEKLKSVLPLSPEGEHPVHNFEGRFPFFTF